MGRNLRSQTINPEVSGVYHCYNQFAQQAFLAGIDPVTGRDYSCRRLWLRRELAGLAGEFAIDILLYALMANHYHLLLRNRPDLVAEWDDFEVLMRWDRIVNRVWRPDDSGQIPGVDWTPNWNQVDRALEDEAHLKTLRLRLSDPSWMIRLWCQSFSRYANKQTGHRGACFQGRFDSVPLVDDAAVLACAMYIDLNPIRAGAAPTPELAEFSSARDRILGRAARSHRATASGLILPDADRLPVELAYAEADDPDHWLAPLANTPGAKLAAILRAWFPEADTIEWSSFATDAEVVTSLQKFLEQRSAAPTTDAASESGPSHAVALTVAPSHATPFVALADALSAAEDAESLAGTASIAPAEVTMSLDHRNAEIALETSLPAPAAATTATDAEVAVSLDAESAAAAMAPNESALARRNGLEFSPASLSFAERQWAAAALFAADPGAMENAPDGPPSKRWRRLAVPDLPPRVSLTGPTIPWGTRFRGTATATFAVCPERWEWGASAATQDQEGSVRARRREELRLSYVMLNRLIGHRSTCAPALAEPERGPSVAVVHQEDPVFGVACYKPRDAEDVAESEQARSRPPLPLEPLVRHLERLCGIHYRSSELAAGDASRPATRGSSSEDVRMGSDARIQCAGCSVVVAPRGRTSRPIPEKHLERWRNFQTARTCPRPRASRDGLLDMTIDEYLEALDWAGRQLKRGKSGAIPRAAPPILERLERLAHVPKLPAPAGVLESVTEGTSTPLSPETRTENTLEAVAQAPGDPSPETPTSCEEWPADAPVVLRTSGIRASALVDLLTSFRVMFRTVAGNAGSVERFLGKLGRRPGRSVANSAAAFD